MGGSISKSVILKKNRNVFGKIRGDLEDLAFLRRPQGKPFRPVEMFEQKKIRRRCQMIARAFILSKR